MRQAIAGGLLLAVLGCYDPIPPSQVVWENPVTSLDQLRPEVAAVVRLDSETSFDRNGALTVETLGDSVFLLYALEGDALAGAKLDRAQISYQARIRTQDLQGDARIELGVRLAGGATYQAVPDMPSAEGTSDWVMQEANFFAGPDEKPDAIFLMLGVKGAGQVWVDQIKVLATPRGTR